jgi:hypothetical protein
MAKIDKLKDLATSKVERIDYLEKENVSKDEAI